MNTRFAGYANLTTAKKTITTQTKTQTYTTMGSRMYHITHPDLNEFFFNAMRLATKEELQRLNITERTYFKNEKAIRRFADNESLDKKLLMLTRLGYQYTLFIKPIKAAIQPLLEKISVQYTEVTTRKQLVEYMAQNKIFALASKEMMVISQMAAQNSHSDIYMMDYRYVQLRDRIRKWVEWGVDSDRMHEAKMATNDLSKVVLSALIGINRTHVIAGITPMQLKALLALYPYRNTYVTGAKVAHMLHESNRTRGIFKVLNILAELDYISKASMREINSNVLQYTILDKGVEAVHDYFKWMLNNL